VSHLTFHDSCSILFVSRVLFVYHLSMGDVTQILEAIELLAEEDPDAAKQIKLKFFAGLSLKNPAASMGMTRRQGDGLWAFARAWLFDYLRDV
jgi:hypothetical protein